MGKMKHKLTEFYLSEVTVYLQGIRAGREKIVHYWELKNRINNTLHSSALPRDEEAEKHI